MTLWIRRKTTDPLQTPPSRPTRVSGGLRPDLVAASARRLAAVALVAAGTSTLFAVVDRIFVPFDPRSAVSMLWLVAVLGSVGLSLCVAWVAYREMLSPEKLLDFGLLYEVVEALFFGLQFHSGAPENAMTRGWTAVAVWILAYPLIVPSTRLKNLVATLAAAAMDPLSLLLNVAVGMPAPPFSRGIVMFLPTAVAAFVGILLSRIVFELTVAAGKGQEMGSYHLEELLGRGGMGEVWKATHRLLARAAAVKLIRPDPGSDSRELLKRFEREARATAALRSPHTVDVYDYGTTEDGTFYYVMELLDGFDLESLVTRFGPLPPERTISILEQACHSLAEAHQGGLIHRDVKPANIYVCRYGLDWDFVKLLDFGLVKKPVSDGSRQLTLAGVIAGTPGYMSPEMGLGSPDVDWRTDIYALGCVGYWLLSGRRVFDEGSPMQIVMDHIQKKPPPASARAKQPIPAELDRILLACLEKDPNNRPQTMQDLAHQLSAVPLDEHWTEERSRHWWLQNGAKARGGPEAGLRLATPGLERTPSSVEDLQAG